MAGPLHGIRILDFTRYQQGPSATVMLSELGAEVVKVEQPGGEPGRMLSRFEDGFSSYFETLNRGKKSIVVDLRKQEGKGVIFRLAEKVDVVAENFRPGVMDRLGVGYDALSPINPRLIFASASMFGPDGPRTMHPGYDTIAQAAGGMVMATRRPGEDLGTPLGGTADQVGGMMLAYGILGALSPPGAHRGGPEGGRVPLWQPTLHPDDRGCQVLLQEFPDDTPAGHRQD